LFVRRGAAAAGRRLQEKRQRAQEQDVVEEHEGKRMHLPLVSCLSMLVLIAPHSFQQMRLIIAAIVLVILGVIIAIAVTVSQSK